VTQILAAADFLAKAEALWPGAEATLRSGRVARVIKEHDECRGPLADIRASGKQVSVSNNVGIFRIADGKVNESRLCWDKYALLQQLGALPPSS
jgi:hypothetical protein